MKLQCPVDTASKRALAEMYEEEAAEGTLEVRVPLYIRARIVCMRCNDARRVLFHRRQWSTPLRWAQREAKHMSWWTLGRWCPHWTVLKATIRCRMRDAWRMLRTPAGAGRAHNYTMLQMPRAGE